MAIMQLTCISQQRQLKTGGICCSKSAINRKSGIWPYWNKLAVSKYHSSCGKILVLNIFCNAIVHFHLIMLALWHKFAFFCLQQPKMEPAKPRFYALLKGFKKPQFVRAMQTWVWIPYVVSSHRSDSRKHKILTRMWANAQCDDHPAKYTRHPLLNTAKFGCRPLLKSVQWCCKYKRMQDLDIRRILHLVKFC